MCLLAFFSSGNAEANGCSNKTAFRQIAVVSGDCGDRKMIKLTNALGGANEGKTMLPNQPGDKPAMFTPLVSAQYAVAAPNPIKVAGLEAIT